MTWISHPIPAASCPKWPGHKLSWKKQDWETSGNASFFKPSHTKKKISFWLFTINHCYHHYYYHYPYWFSQAKSTFLGNNDLTNQRLFFTNSPSGCLWLRWTDFGATRVLVFIGRRLGGWRPAFSRHRNFLKSNCFCVDMTIRKFETNTIFCVDAIFCENKSLVPSCLVSSTFGCPQYPQTTWRFD